MKKKALLFAMLLALLLAALAVVGCKEGDTEPTEDTGPYDPAKVAVSDLSAELSAELGSRYTIPLPTVTYGGFPKAVTFTVTDQDGDSVELIAQGTRIYVDDIRGYTIEYFIEHLEEQHLIGSSAVTVQDSTGPEIELPASAYSMTVGIDSVVEIPEAVITDGSGVVASSSVSVTFNGKPVSITEGADGAADTFVTDAYGEYTITYTATDGSGNESTETAVVNCARMVVLCDFENDSVVWGEGDSSFTTEHAYSGNALKMSTTGSASYYMVAVYPTVYNLSGFDRLSINIWVSRDLTSGNEGFYLLNQVFRLQEGNNILTIDREALNSQYPGGIVPSSLPQYTSYGYLWFQVCGDGVDFYIDNLVGIYDSFDEDDQAPTIDFGRDHAVGTMAVSEGSALRVPEVTGLDNTMEPVTIDYTVCTSDGTDVTDAVKAGTYKAAAEEVYTITYVATDVNGNKGTRDFTITVRKQEQIDLPAGDDLPTDRTYDMLQDFETGVGSSVLVSPEELIPDADAALTETYARSGKAVQVGPTAFSGYAAVMIKLLKDGQVLTQEDFAAYDYLQLSVVCDTDGTQFWLYNQRYDLQRGLNVLRFSQSVLQAQIDEASYNAEGWLWFQTVPVEAGAEYTLWLDQFIGVYAEEDEPGGDPAQRSDLLNDFETGQDSSVWVQGGVTNTSTNAVDGMAVQFTTSADWQAISIAIKKNGAVLTREDFAAYAYLQMNVYADKAGATLYFFNHSVATLEEGMNVVTISIEDFLAQYDAGLAANPPAYSSAGFSYWQIGNGSAAYTLYLDNLIGVYAGEQPDPDPDPDIPDDTDPYDHHKVDVIGEDPYLTAELGALYTIPVPVITYGGVAKDVLVIVYDSNGEQVEAADADGAIRISDEEGYTVNYYIEHLDAYFYVTTATISVQDTQGPVIELPASAYSMTVELGSVVEIPEAVITDGSGVVVSSKVTVTLNGASVAVTEGEDGAPSTFKADAYGEYILVYTAEDGMGNISSLKITIECARMVTLCDFENGDEVWGAGTSSFTTEHAYSGNALKMSTTGSSSYYTIAVYPTLYNLSGFDRFALDVWVSRDLTGNEGLYLLNHKFTLQAGANTLVFDKEVLQSQYPGGIVPSTDPAYASYAYLWFQVCGDGVDFYIDHFVGIYDSYETDKTAPVVEFGKEYASGSMIVEEGAVLSVPEMSASDNSLASVTVDYTVATGEGVDITDAVKAGSYRAVAGETYVVTYMATDASGNTGERDFTITVRVREPIVVPEGDDLPTDRTYDMLQDFETGLNASVSVSPEELVPDAGAALTETYARSGKAMQIGTTSYSGFAAVRIKLLKDGQVLTQEDFAAYDYLQLSVVCDTDGTQFWLYNQRYDLQRGLNVLRFSQSVLQAQINETSYNAEGWLWFQTVPVEAGAEYTLWLDQFIGVYPEGGAAEQNYDLLNDFETGQDSSVWVQGGVTNTSTNAVDGMAVQFTTSADWQAISIAIKKNGAVLTREDFAAYAYLQMNVYADKAGATLYFYNHSVATLEEGMNVVTISMEDFLAEYDSSSSAYPANGFSFWQIGNGSAAYTLYLDNLIGVYPEV